MSDQYPGSGDASGYGGQQWNPPPPPPGQYGYPPQPYGQYGRPQAPQPNGLATAGMVVGIISVVLFWVPFLGIVLGILAISFGGVGVARANRGATNKGQAVAGLVLGIVCLALYAIAIAAYVSSH